MANPQKENGHIGIANEVVEALMKVNLSPYESRCLWFIFRKTYGWQKKTDWITLSQFSKCIGLDRRLIHRALKSLSSKMMIVIKRDDKNHIRYGFQKNYEKWKVSSAKMTVISRDDGVSSVEMTEVSSVEIPTKEIVTKEIITNNDSKESLSKIQNLDASNNSNCPHREIINLYHEILPEMAKIKSWPPNLQKILRTRWKEEPERKNLAWWRAYFQYVRESPFLMGGKTDFIADMEWIIRPTNMTKILNGRYHARGSPGTQKFIGIKEWLERKRNEQ